MASVIDAPVGMLEAVADLRLPPKANQRLQDLMGRVRDAGSWHASP